MGSAGARTSVAALVRLVRVLLDGGGRSSCAAEGGGAKSSAAAASTKTTFSAGVVRREGSSILAEVGREVERGRRPALAGEVRGRDGMLGNELVGPRVVRWRPEPLDWLESELELLDGAT